MSMLRAHYYHRTLSMERIAHFGGYGEFRAGNLQYGALCGRMARELGFVHRSKTYTIASGSGEDDSQGHFQWRMDDVVTRALKQLGWFPPLSDKTLLGEDFPTELKDVPETGREAITKARIGQVAFRLGVISLWGCCAVTGCALESVLVSSHIVPWKDATNTERLDPLNGLLLTPNFDSLFDQFLISFNDDGSILLSKDLTAEERAILEECCLP